MKKYGKGMGILLLTAVFVCGAVQPVFADENELTDTNKKKVEEFVDEDTEGSSGGDFLIKKEWNSKEIKDDDSQPQLLAVNEDKEAPSITADSITWEGGLLKVPVDLGSYTADELLLNLSIDSDTYSAMGTMGTMTIEGNNAVYSPIQNFWSYDREGERFWTKAGTYIATVEFFLCDYRNEFGASYTGLCEDSFSLTIPYDSNMWQVETKKVKLDGSEDLTFSFTNGTNYYELKSIEHIELRMLKGGAPNLTSGFSFDMSAGTLTLDRNVVRAELIKAVQEARKTEPDICPANAYVNVYAVTSSGEEVPFNRIASGKDPGTMVAGGTIAWELDLTDFDWTAGDLQIVPEATDTAYTKGNWDGATIKCTGALEDFVSVFVDGTLVDKSNYTLESGSTILTFTPRYMNTLSLGKHTVTMNYTYGSVNTELTVQTRTGSGGGSPGGSGSDSTSKPDTPNSTIPANPTESTTSVPSNPTEATSTVSANGSNTSGSATSVQTGDSTTVTVWVLSAMFAAGLCGVLGWKRCSGKF